MPRVDFYFDLFSPTSYLAWLQLPGLRQSGAEVIFWPVHLQSVLRQVGTSHPLSDQRKAQWMWADLRRHAARLGGPLRQSDAPFRDSLPVMAAAVKAQRTGELDSFCACLFRGVWAAGIDPASGDAIHAALAIAGLDGAKYLAAPDPEDRAQLLQNTGDLVARGGFGVPSIFIGDDLFFGHDRVDLVSKQLGARHAKATV